MKILKMLRPGWYVAVGAGVALIILGALIDSIVPLVLAQFAGLTAALFIRQEA